MKTYRYSPFPPILLFLLFLLGCYLTIEAYYSKSLEQLILYIIFTPGMLWGCFLTLFVTISVSDQSVMLESKNFMNSRQINWLDIEAVIDDSPFPRFQFTHIYHLIPKRKSLEKPKKRIILTTYFKNYKDLLKEVVLRVSPDTKIDGNILKLTGLTQQDIGKCYKPLE